MSNKKITEYQKTFLLSIFENSKYPGWINIAEKLINSGSCIVAGTSCIWKGGIGNFIKTTANPEGTVDCSLYSFDLEYFLTSAWYKEMQENEIAQLSLSVDDARQALIEAKHRLLDITSLHQ